MQPESTDNEPATVAQSTQDHIELELGAVDIVMGLLTLPLLPWFLMWAVSGAEQLLATRSSRIRVYLVLLAIEIVIGVAVAAWLVLR